ncbi:hypothetical protein N0M98_24660 [Paenibacillus doosanensis]|nr:hypothetical protein [Paenibacillus doosanensis]
MCFRAARFPGCLRCRLPHFEVSGLAAASVLLGFILCVALMLKYTFNKKMTRANYTVCNGKL